MSATNDEEFKAFIKAMMMGVIEGEKAQKEKATAHARDVEQRIAALEGAVTVGGFTIVLSVFAMILHRAIV